MALIGLKRASELTGKNQSTIHRAMKSGRISFTVSESGERLIDPGELDRVFPVSVPTNGTRNDAPNGQGNDAQLAELRRELQHKDELLTKEQQERRRDQGMIDELQRQLAAANEERRTTLRQLTALLTDQRAKPIITPPPTETAAAPPAPAKRRWRLFGGRG